MALGKYRHLVTIQQRSVTRDANMGSEIVVWADVMTIWAQFDPIRGREFFAVKQEKSETLARFYTRYCTGIDTEMRIAHDGKYYDIVGVVDVSGLGRELELMTIHGLKND